MNLTAEQARAQVVLAAGRVRSAQETLAHLVAQEPRLRAYLDEVVRSMRGTSWELRQAGENLELLYAKVWPPIDIEVRPVVGHVRVSPLDAGWPQKRTGRPWRSGGE